MIFGMTNTERSYREQLRRQQRRKWRSWFAWRPVQLTNGRYAWLQTVETAMVWSNFWARDIRRYRLLRD
ncbi:hypothetical protein [Inquilinus limosus]|uniref:hypothetical protein n=1 Tax=Inquilinus limosus TaxID=171674 RepID=UPI00047D62BB|nr:hypothetical protein [Inquilinus limosus]